MFLPIPSEFIYLQHPHVPVLETKDGAPSKSLDVPQPHNIYVSKAVLLYSVQSGVDQLAEYFEHSS